MDAFAELYINAPEFSRRSAQNTGGLLPLDSSSLQPDHGTGLTRVLLVGCDPHLQQELQHRLHAPQWEVHHAAGGAAALVCLQKQSFSMALVAPLLPDLDVVEFRSLVQTRFPAVQVLPLEGLAAGAPTGPAPTQPNKGLPPTRTPSRVAPAFASPVPGTIAAQGPANATGRWEGMVGTSPAMQGIFRRAALVARRDTTVLILGESGTGKDLLARGIHNSGTRARQPFVVINCAAIPEALLEAELFGFTKGSFTGATQSRTGRVHAAHGGTLFLDEIGDMPLALQSKMLRFLEQGEVQRIGSSETLRVDCRIVAATNANLLEQVQARQFREDLYYRLAVLPIAMPPLRERLGDVPALCAGFLERFSPGSTLHPEALQQLLQHSWPGNVRELRNAMERATLFADGRREILAEDIFL